jgi:drug/metabolite transporter (DMT)-like permease
MDPRPAASRTAAQGMGLAAVAALGWGAMFPIAKSGLRHVDALHMTAIRYGIASLGFLALLAAAEGRAALRPEGRALRLYVLGSLGFAGFNLLSYVGLGMTRPQNAALVTALMPFVTLLVLRVRDGARVSREKGALMAAGFLGVVAVISRGRPAEIVGGGIGGGEALVLAGATCWVFYTLGAARFAGFSPLRYTALSATGGTLTILLVTLVASLAGWEPVPSAHDLGAAWWQLSYIVVVGALVAVLSWNAAVRRIGPATAVLFSNLLPVTAFAIAVAGGYAANGWEIGGALVAVAALAGVNVLGRREAATVQRACPSSVSTPSSPRPRTSRRPSTSSRRASEPASAS